MKATVSKISKSAVMTRAWEVEKANVVFRIKQEEEAIQKAWYKENEEAIRSVIFNSMGCPSSLWKWCLFRRLISINIIKHDDRN